MQLVKLTRFLLKSTNKCNFSLNIFQIMMLAFSQKGVYNRGHKALMETSARHLPQSERRVVKAPQANPCDHPSGAAASKENE